MSLGVPRLLNQDQYFPDFLWSTFLVLKQKLCLAGALFGLYYALKGQQVIWPEFRKLADYLTAGKEDQY